MLLLQFLLLVGGGVVVVAVSLITFFLERCFRFVSAFVKGVLNLAVSTWIVPAFVVLVDALEEYRNINQ